MKSCLIWEATEFRLILARKNTTDKEAKDLALTLHQAVSDTAATRLTVHMEGGVKPDLLQHEAHAIMTGVVGADGVFYATELLLKCPSRYEEGVPEQVES